MNLSYFTIEAVDVILVGDNAIMASGDALGPITKLQRAVPNTGGASSIVKVVVTDASKQKSKIVLYFFSKLITGGTTNAPFNPTAADALLCLGSITINTTDYQDLSAVSIATVTIPEGFSIKLPSGKDVYVQAVVYGTPTYAAGATDVHLRVDFQKAT